MFRSIIAIGVLALSAAVIPVSTFAEDAGSGRMFTLEILVRLNEHRIYERSFTVSPDSRHVAVAAQDDAGSYVVVDGKEGRRYGFIGEKSLSFAPDSARFAYVAGSEPRFFVVVDETRLKGYPSVKPGPPVFSPDGGKLAFVASSLGKEFVVECVLDGPKYTTEEAYRILFGPDGGWLAFVTVSVERGISISKLTEGPRYDSIDKASLKYGPDGSRLAYAAARGRSKMVVYGGTESEAYDDVYRPVFGVSGDKLAFVAKKGSDWFVVVDGKKGRAYNSIRHESLTLDSSGLPVYIACANSKQMVVHGTSEAKPRTEIKGLAVSPDGRHIAYSAKVKKGWLVCVDGHDGKTYDRVGSYVRISSDGRHYAYSALRGQDWFFVHDGVEAGPYMCVAENNVALSPDGGRYAYLAQLGRREWAPFVDGVKLKSAQGIPGELVFSPAGEHLANIGISGVKQYIAVDGESIADYDGIVIWSGGRVVFDDEDSLHYLAVKQRAVFLVEEFYE